MITLNSALIPIKNLLAQEYPWLMLFDVTMGVEEPLHLVRNVDNVTYLTTEYTAFDIKAEEIDNQNIKGELASFDVKITNVGQVYQAKVEEYNGFIEEEVTIHTVNANYLSVDHSALDLVYSIVDCTLTDSDITFTVGASNPLMRRIPLYRERASHCNWVSNFKGIECRYAGVDTTCLGTLSACQLKSNSLAFGGAIGLEGGGIRIA